jgi:hypothetical protein
MKHWLRVTATGAGAALMAVIALAAGVGTPMSAVAAGNDDVHAVVLQASLAPSVPGDPTIFGVAPGGAPWALKEGHVQLGQDGRLQVNVTGLVLTATGMNPLPDLGASVFCNGTLVATTTPVAFAGNGNARIHATVSLPAFCPAPAVLLNPATSNSPGDVRTAVYIAFDGIA